MTETEADAKTAPKPATPKPEPKFKGQAVDGYAVVKTTPGYDQLHATGDADPAWLTRCNAHGTTTPAGNRKAGRALGSSAARAAWCKGCKTAAAKTAAAK